MIKSKLQNEAFLEINTPYGIIEALHNQQHSNICAVVCAPHPHFDGSMHNKVVTTCVQSCADLGLSTLRFNYRGVGNSSGSLPTYDAAKQDVTFVCNWLNYSSILWLGFSYGSYIAAYGCGLTSSTGLITIAPSAKKMPFSHLPEIKLPWHIIQGSDDEVIDIPSNIKLAENNNCSWIDINDAGHFFHGKLSPLRAAIVNSAKKIIQAC